jgi:hypothetical protein
MHCVGEIAYVDFFRRVMVMVVGASSEPGVQPTACAR